VNERDGEKERNGEQRRRQRADVSIRSFAFTRISPTFSLVPFLAAVALRTVYSNCVLPSHIHPNLQILLL